MVLKADPTRVCGEFTQEQVSTAMWGVEGTRQEERVPACTHTGQRPTLGKERTECEVVAAGHQCCERLRGGEGLGQGLT